MEMERETEQIRTLKTALDEITSRAREAFRSLSQTSGATRARALHAASRHLRAHSELILQANAKDMELARQKGHKEAFLDRLKLTPKRVLEMAQGLEKVAALPDPLHKVQAQWTRPNGLEIQRVSVPIGVIAVIYESRPNVTADAAALCIKSGNCVILRGGSESALTTHEILSAFQEGIFEAGIPKEAAQKVPTQDRAAVGLLMSMPGKIDLLVPRGGERLTRRVAEESLVPSLLHLEGVCHTYIHHSAALDLAKRVVVNAKMRRPGICGATEALLVDRAWGQENLREVLVALREANCELRGDEKACQALPGEVSPAKQEDWGKEFLDSILAVRVVEGLPQAVGHIQKYGSGHSEAILASDEKAVQDFRKEVDASIVFHNVSTQYADGGEFGMGAEIGISTGRLHARGPVGAAQLTTYTYWVSGDGLARPS